jgi:hypothetical protein
MISAQEAKKLNPVEGYKRLTDAFEDQVRTAAYSGLTFVLLTDVFKSADIRFNTDCGLYDRLRQELKDAGYALEGNLVVCWRNA